MENIEFHALAEIFPLIHGREFVELKADIKANGVHEPIVMYEGQILDGRNRFRACQETGVTPEFVEYEGVDPVSYVISLNLYRRHLNESQRGMVAAKLANIENGGDRFTEQSANLQSGSTSRAEAAELLNVSERTVNTAKKVEQRGAPELVDAVEQGQVSVSAAADIATLTVDEQAEVVAKGEKEILAAAKEIRAKKAKKKRDQRVEKIEEISAGNTDLPTGRTYPVIYADPPWRYDYSETTGREIENQYPTMDIEDICALDVPAADDCVLFLWTTAPKLEEGMRVVREWGFEYKTCAIWDKQKMGMGYYFRVQHEILLIATKGSIPTPEAANRPRSVISIPYDGHSAKPHEIAEMIEKMYPELSKLEMFCRSPRNGWDVWGNQSDAS